MKGCKMKMAKIDSFDFFEIKRSKVEALVHPITGLRWLLLFYLDSSRLKGKGGKKQSLLSLKVIYSVY